MSGGTLAGLRKRRRAAASAAAEKLLCKKSFQTGSSLTEAAFKETSSPFLAPAGLHTPPRAPASIALPLPGRPLPLPDVCGRPVGEKRFLAVFFQTCCE